MEGNRDLAFRGVHGVSEDTFTQHWRPPQKETQVGARLNAATSAESAFAVCCWDAAQWMTLCYSNFNVLQAQQVSFHAGPLHCIAQQDNWAALLLRWQPFVLHFTFSSQNKHYNTRCNPSAMTVYGKICKLIASTFPQESLAGPSSPTYY